MPLKAGTQKARATWAKNQEAHRERLGRQGKRTLSVIVSRNTIEGLLQRQESLSGSAGKRPTLGEVVDRVVEHSLQGNGLYTNTTFGLDQLKEELLFRFSIQRQLPQSQEDLERIIYAVFQRFSAADFVPE